MCCAQPYFNEPAYYNDEGTPSGDRANEGYNGAVRKDSAKFAILEPLEKPLTSPWGVFRDVLRLHWAAKASAIKAHVREAAGVPEALRTQIPAALDAYEETFRRAVEAEANVAAEAAERSEAAAREAEHRRVLEALRGESVGAGTSAMRT